MCCTLYTRTPCESPRASSPGGRKPNCRLTKRGRGGGVFLPNCPTEWKKTLALALTGLTLTWKLPAIHAAGSQKPKALELGPFQRRDHIFQASKTQKAFERRFGQVGDRHGTSGSTVLSVWGSIPRFGCCRSEPQVVNLGTCHQEAPGEEGANIQICIYIYIQVYISIYTPLSLFTP